MTIHHLELWVPDFERGARSWGWLLGELGYEPYQTFDSGCSWRRGPTYVVIEQSSAMDVSVPPSRMRPGMNHVAFHVDSRIQIDRLVESAPRHGWSLLFPDRHPHAGGPDSYAAYLENDDGFEVELVAD